VPHHDEGGAGNLRLGDLDGVRQHPGLDQRVHEDLARLVAPDACEELRLQAEPRGGDGLVRPLTARVSNERADQAFPRRRQPFDVEAEIEVRRAEEDKRRLAHLTAPKVRPRSRWRCPTIIRMTGTIMVTTSPAAMTG